jgi:hypothetical protein
VITDVLKKTGASSVGAKVQVQATGSSKIPVTIYINAQRLNSENGLFKWHFFHTYELFQGDFLITMHYF